MSESDFEITAPELAFGLEQSQAGEDSVRQSFSAPVPPEFTDEALALEFSDRYKDDLRYVSHWGKWQKWDGMRWIEEKTLETADRARGICRDASARAACDRSVPANIARRCADARTSSAVERLARADRRHAATVDQWDIDPWMLNTPAGVIDLRGGNMQSHQPHQYVTKITAAAPGGDCPIWQNFLSRAMGGDAELVGFMRRMAGYFLTGCTKEHALFFCYGTGGNGKSVFINTISGILAEYAATSPMETFTASASERHPTDLAGLRGARLVTAQETEEGRYWAESRIKSITGGDSVSARFMRQDYFTYTPQFKLLIGGNHKPVLRNVDEAIGRRLHLILSIGAEK